MVEIQNFKLIDDYLVLNREAFKLENVDVIRIQQYGNIALGYSMQMIVNGGADLREFNDIATIRKEEVEYPFIQLKKQLAEEGFDNFAEINSTYLVNMDNVNKVFAKRGAFSEQDCVCIELNSGRRCYALTDSLDEAQELVIKYAKQYNQYISSKGLQQ